VSAGSVGREDWGGVDGVLLAAGLSSRSKRYKMTLPLGGRTVIEQSLAGMADVVRRVYVVVGWQSERLVQLLAGYDKVSFVINERFREGMFSSVKVGIARVRAPGFFLLPGDQPLIGAQVYRQMLSVRAEIVIPTFRGQKGHPVLFDRRCVPEILAQPEGTTLRDYVEGKGYTCVEVQDEGILIDLDTAEDYDHVRTRYADRI
jgi:molybdenum cofactor cytidylyltransferase